MIKTKGNVKLSLPGVNFFVVGCRDFHPQFPRFLLGMTGTMAFLLATIDEETSRVAF